jgi:hypothetical protein
MGSLNSLNYSAEDIEGKKEGDIVFIGGKRFKLIKSTGRSIAVERWYWFDVLIQRLLKKARCP